MEHHDHEEAAQYKYAIIHQRISNSNCPAHSKPTQQEYMIGNDDQPANAEDDPESCD
jgi:hypothetical protein